MSKELEDIVVLTVPAITKADSFKAPYRRVVGLKHDDLRRDGMWARTFHGWNIDDYSPNDARPETITLAAEQVPRLIGFFNKFFVEVDGFKREGYNCHRFAYWMQSSPLASHDTDPDGPDHIVKNGVLVEHNLPVGAHGTLGTRTDELLYGRALHSVIGLGEDRSEVLQVVSHLGFLSIDTYENMYSFYKRSPEFGIEMFTDA